MMSTSEDEEHGVPTSAEAEDTGPDLSVLDDLDGRPLHEHVAAYDELHARLQNALNRIDGV
ncbi:MAG TPA: hypothetical protein VGH43_17505 [Jatrophihabitans sp.]